MPFDFIGPALAVGDALFGDDEPAPQKKAAPAPTQNVQTQSGSPIPNLTPQVIQGKPVDFDFGGNFSNPMQGYADGHQVHDPIPHRMHHGNPVFNFEGDFGGFEDFPHFAEGGHNPQFFSEGGLQNRYVQGEGDGTSDGVPAMLATGEFVIPADVVSALGNGDNNSGAGVLDSFMTTIRSHKQDHNPEELPPDSMGPLEYLRMATQTEEA